MERFCSFYVREERREKEKEEEVEKLLDGGMEDKIKGVKRIIRNL